MNEPLAERVAVVTGGGRGLGRAMVLGLARAGARVIATAARERGEIDEVARESENIVPLLADVSREEDCSRVVAEAMARFGRLDVLVNNAGRGMRYVSESFMTEPTRFWEVDPAASVARVRALGWRHRNALRCRAVARRPPRERSSRGST